MTPFITKRAPKFYIAIGFAFIFFCACGVLMGNLFYERLNEGFLSSKDYWLPLISIGFISMGVFTVTKHIKNAPEISLDSRTIRFGENEIFQLKDIKEIQLTGKMPFKFLIIIPMEGGCLEFKDGSMKYFFDDMYSNGWQLKSLLENLVINEYGLEKGRLVNLTTKDISLENIETFSGNQLISMRGIGLWGMLIFFTYLLLMIPLPSIEVIIFFIVFSIFWFLLNSNLMHFFKLSTKYLVIKNHNLIWKEHVYKLDDIKEIAVETQGRMPNCLRVITKDFRNKIYPAGTLSDKTWMVLMEQLQARGIHVRNECIRNKHSKHSQ